MAARRAGWRVRAGAGALTFAVVVSASACASHYRVTEPGSGKVYYTKHVHQRGGAVEFTDARTNSRVTIQSSEVTKISGKEFKEGIKAPSK